MNDAATCVNVAGLTTSTVFAPVCNLVASQQQRAQQRKRGSIRGWLDTCELVAAEVQLLQHGLMCLQRRKPKLEKALTGVRKVPRSSAPGFRFPTTP